MKRLLLCFVSMLLLASCGSTNNSTSSDSSIKEDNAFYLDYSEKTTPVYSVKTEQATASGTTNHSFSLIMLIKNVSPAKQEYAIGTPTLIRESTGASYTVNDTLFLNNRIISLDSEIETRLYFTSTIPTSLEEKYCFSLDINKEQYKLYLYETPDELREDLTVTYVVGSNTVYTETVKKGRTVKTVYSYDDESHQNYVSGWRDQNGKVFTNTTEVEDNLTLTGALSENLKFFTTSSDTYTFLSEVKHVPSDGKVVVPEKHQNKVVCLSNYAIYNNASIKEVYIPATMPKFYYGNFTSCRNLKTIYYAGSKEQWDAIEKSTSEIPSTIQIVYNTPFKNN